MPNGKQQPPPCWRCGGTGIYVWGAIVNGKPTHSGPCYACQGGGEFPPTQGKFYRVRKAANNQREA